MANRYDNQRTALLPHRSGSHVTVVLRKPRYRTRTNFVSYTVTSADRMWTIADRYYHDSSVWWQIADLNPAVPCPDDLFFGMKLAIPT
jgi:nucleoid-associated protein YgaU